MATVSELVRRCLVSRPDGEDVEAVMLLREALRAAGDSSRYERLGELLGGLVSGLGARIGEDLAAVNARWVREAWQEFRAGVARLFIAELYTEDEIFGVIRRGSRREPPTISGGAVVR